MISRNDIQRYTTGRKSSFGQRKNHGNESNSLHCCVKVWVDAAVIEFFKEARGANPSRNDLGETMLIEARERS